MRTPSLLAFGLMTISACVTENATPTEADIDATRGAALFAQDCAACHGAMGTGVIGPDLTTLSSRNGGAFPRDRVMATIDGLGRHEEAGGVMPEFGANGLGPTVIVEHDGLGTPVPADLLALTAFLEEIQR
ncbi:Cytochrome C oxidase, cbb3-type, subunit III [Jannaschia faecimaris]|uniref:Cytochrome C oxidase, cbb3-type, subunit III n=1 Tax=Jannaschia faecimaris TaxID=1244108 RepID=A0A1H3JBW0_9RHOB|nr:cytochrome c [Jannaschia faecimaris]SDY37453.1 Cytochrome C oxidase, cbb3-type, subunit III [Jannaschia faecimaris]